MKLGFVFPGQGSQFVGMGKDYYEKYECVREVYNKANQILGFDIAKLSFEGPEEDLNQTKNTQMAILVMSLAIVELLKQNNIQADISAGLSLGEYSALIYSNIINFEDGIKIVQKRGTYMQECLPKGNWSMAAILGLDDTTIEDVCKQVTKGFVVPANYNCQGQVAISGEKEAVLQAMELLKDAGAKRAIELKTSGPFHTSKLQEASDKLYEALQEIQINKIADKKVIKNIDATEYANDDDIKRILANHVINPVKFKKSIENMIAQGVDTIIEIGPGKVLSGFVKKTNKDIRVFNTNNIEAFEQILSELK
ncbi:MAG: ACP S-malonyltransferase [Clostridia bacterium]|nr:ACP S-malonyltransferase [Clostridia bacterium]